VSVTTGPAVHQFVPVLEPGAVGAHVLEVQRALRAWGVVSEIFTEHVHAACAGLALRFDSYGRTHPAAPDDVLVYHVAIGSVVADFVLEQAARIVVDHHNITPAEHFAPWEPDLVPGLRWGRRQLADLASVAVLGLADSAYNAAELAALGCERTVVVPILLDLASLTGPADPATAARLAADRTAGGAELLVVGRVAPHKAQHRLVESLAILRHCFDPRARLRVVGGSASDRYVDALRGLVDDLGLADAVELTGAVGDAVLRSYYQAADVYVSASEHEGFCVPVLEAWAHGMPVVARAAGALGETVGGAGIVLDDADPAALAVAVHRVLSDGELATALRAAGRERLQAFAPDRTAAVLRAALAPLLGAAEPVPASHGMRQP
jgi:glycosyltransferase involved in cell wall biosynthesis